MKEKLCYETSIIAEWPIRLLQCGIDSFTYGKQVKQGLNYSRAASELGACIMHALACDGKLDNSERH